jgi:hypothetical protein
MSIDVPTTVISRLARFQIQELCSPFDVVVRPLLCETLETMACVDLSPNLVLCYLLRFVVAAYPQKMVYTTCNVPEMYDIRLGFNIPNRTLTINNVENDNELKRTDHFIPSISQSFRNLSREIGEETHV